MLNSNPYVGIAPFNQKPAASASPQYITSSSDPERNYVPLSSKEGSKRIDQTSKELNSTDTAATKVRKAMPLTHDVKTEASRENR